MKTRILDTLQKLAKTSHPLKHELCKSLGIDDNQLKSRSQEVLHRILHNYSTFSISTIDSFFQKVVRTFAKEMGIQGGFQVELNQKKVISEAVDKLLLEVGQDKKLTDWLAYFAIFNITQGKKWDPKKDIKNLSDELFKEIFILNKETIFEKIDNTTCMQNYLSSLHSIRKNFETTMQDFGRRAMDILLRKGLNIDDFTRKQVGIGAYFNKLSKGIFPQPNSYVLEVLNDHAWYSKNSTKKDIIDAAVNMGLYDLLEQSIHFRATNFTQYFTVVSVVKHIYSLGILSKVNQYLYQYRAENDTLLISDFPVFLNGIISNSNTPYIYEKIGSKYKHYLIDEFQDTSALQWNNFKPLIKDSLAANQFNMIVGDIKQSIYRWRGGNWKLLLEEVQKDIGENMVNNKELKTNWRSKKAIIDFNNNLFKSAPGILYYNLKAKTSLDISGIESIKNAYQDAYQNIPKGKDNVKGGLVEVKFFESKNKSEFEEQSLEVMIEKIEQLQDASYKLKDIAILVRTSMEGKKVTDALMKYEKTHSNSKYAYDIISNESLYLKNSPIVNFIIQSFYYILDDSEPLHLVQLKYAFNWHLIVNNKDNKEVENILKSNLQSIKSLPLVDLIEALIRLFNLKNDKTHIPYLLAFQDAVLDYSKNKNADIKGFLFWWQENNQQSIQVSENQNAMRLMTVHKSKGLQFKTVILPFCTWDLDHGTGGDRQNILWCDTKNRESFSYLPFLPLKYKSDMVHTYFSTNYQEEKAKAYMDNINLLYVACTRAEEVLYIMAKSPKKKEYLSKISDLLYKILSKNETDNWIEEKLEYTSGEMASFGEYEESKGYEEISLNHFISQPWNQRKELQPRQNEFWYDENVKTKINEGKLIHWILSKIKYSNNLNKAIIQAKNEFHLKEKALNKIKIKLNKLFTNDIVSDWFLDKWEVKNEINILSLDSNIQRPDRVIINDNQTIVIDYKTGIDSGFHTKQVGLYCSLLKEMGFKNVTGYLLYTNKCNVVKVHN